MPRAAPPRPAIVLTLGTLMLGLGAGCGTSSSSGGSAGQGVPCDPTAAGPITPGAIVGVGQDIDGTLYVDAANGVFVRAGGALIRQHLLAEDLSFTCLHPSS